jgi:FO synthase
VLTKDEMAALAPYNASLGLMLESTSERLCEKGMPHHRAPDKRPAVRLQMLEEAGELRIPFTSGILVGIGETEEERVEALVAIRASHRRHGHVQEVIVQPFRPHAGTPMASADGCSDEVLARSIALARLILDEDVTVQAPPNLAPLELMLDAGINDLGGISPLTPDFINVTHAWPHIARLSEQLETLGFELAPRLPVHAAFAHLAPPSVLQVAP